MFLPNKKANKFSIISVAFSAVAGIGILGFSRQGATGSRKIMLRALFSLVIALFIFTSCFKAVQHKDYVELNNSALKTAIESSEINEADILRMVRSHDFQKLDKMYDVFLSLYRQDVKYEWQLQEAYNLFDPDKDISIQDLDSWVNTTSSYASYAARGVYKTYEGYNTGGLYIKDSATIAEMQRHHSAAVDDLLIAIKKNSFLMPAYAYLINIAKASQTPFTANEMLTRAEEVDRRNYYTRYEYIITLRPRFGGSIDKMAAFANSTAKYSDINPRLWSLQGEVSALTAKSFFDDGNYTAAITAYTDAMKYGDRVFWLKNRAVAYNKLMQFDQARTDFKKIIFYDKENELALLLTDQGSKCDITSEIYLDPNIDKYQMKSFAILPVVNKVGWLRSRPYQEQEILSDNLARIVLMVKQLGYQYIGNAKDSPSADSLYLPADQLSSDTIQQVGKKIGADAVIIAIIPELGRNHPKSLYYEKIEINAISSEDGRLLWKASLKGTVFTANPLVYDQNLILGYIETKLYDSLTKTLSDVYSPGGKTRHGNITKLGQNGFAGY